MSLEFEFQPQRPSAEKLRTMEADQWQYLVSRIDDTATAKLIVDYLEDDPVRRQSLAGIYLRACDTIQRSRQAGESGPLRTGLLTRLIRGAAGKLPPSSGDVQPERGAQLVWPTLNLQ